MPGAVVLNHAITDYHIAVVIQADAAALFGRGVACKGRVAHSERTIFTKQTAAAGDVGTGGIEDISRFR